MTGAELIALIAALTALAGAAGALAKSVRDVITAIKELIDRPASVVNIHTTQDVLPVVNTTPQAPTEGPPPSA